MQTSKAVKLLALTLLLDVLLTVVAIMIFGVPEDSIIVAINITIFVILLSFNMLFYRKESKRSILTLTLLSPVILKTSNELLHGNFSLALVLSIIILFMYATNDDGFKNN